MNKLSDHDADIYFFWTCNVLPEDEALEIAFLQSDGKPDFSNPEFLQTVEEIDEHHFYFNRE